MRTMCNVVNNIFNTLRMDKGGTGINWDLARVQRKGATGEWKCIIITLEGYETALAKDTPKATVDQVSISRDENEVLFLRLPGDSNVQ